jgi:hypothetical protein
MELTKLTKAAIKEYLKPPADFDFATTAWHPLTLDPDRSWFKVDCPEGHEHVIEWDGKTETVFECDVSGKKYAVTPDSKP